MSILIVIGAGGLAKQAILDLKTNLDSGQELVFFDDSSHAPVDFFGHKVLHDFDEIPTGFSFAICVGDPRWRAHFFSQLIEMGGDPVNVISKQAVVFDAVKHTMQSGNLILTQAILEPDVRLGKGNVINTAASIHHDVQIGDFCEIMPGARLLGGVKVGSHCRIGAGSVILPDIEIGDGAVIAAGAIVTKNVSAGTMVAGNPAVWKKNI